MSIAPTHGSDLVRPTASPMIETSRWQSSALKKQSALGAGETFLLNLILDGFVTSKIEVMTLLLTLSQCESITQVMKSGSKALSLKSRTLRITMLGASKIQEASKMRDGIPEISATKAGARTMTVMKLRRLILGQIPHVIHRTTEDPEIPMLQEGLLEITGAKATTEALVITAIPQLPHLNCLISAHQVTKMNTHIVIMINMQIAVRIVTHTVVRVDKHIVVRVDPHAVVKTDPHVEVKID